MKRREFIKDSLLASSLLFVPRFMKAFESQNLPNLGNKKLVVIQLAGGNDGLNTVIPYQNDLYYKKRPSLAFSKNNILTLNDELGFHQSLKAFKALYDKGYVSIINNVGYPNPNRSHFRSTDIWQTASDSNAYFSTGWIGRYLDENNAEPHLAIELDNSLSLILKGAHKTGLATKNTSGLYKLTHNPFFEKLLNEQKNKAIHVHNNAAYLYQTLIDASSSAKYIFETSKTYKSKISYPKNPFANQLKTTATFINSHLNSKVYFVSMGGFDTHTNQLTRQSKLLQVFSESIATFVKDLEQHDTFKDTLILVFSEFGRRVKENASSGTDHGTANNVFIIGKNLKKPGIYNELPNLADLDKNGDLKYSMDFRSVYATILSNWMDADAGKILRNDFKKLDFI